MLSPDEKNATVWALEVATREDETRARGFDKGSQPHTKLTRRAGLLRAAAAKLRGNRSPDRVAAALASASDGLTVNELSTLTGIAQPHMRAALDAVAGAYIDRWVKEGRQVTAVWCVVTVPQDCPRPEAKRSRSGRPGAAPRTPRAAQSPPGHAP